MEGPTSSSYREWDKADRDGKWFWSGRNPNDRILNAVRPLAVDYAERLWRWIFPTKEEVLPLIAKTKKGWLSKVFENEAIYFGGTQAPSLSSILQRHFKWNGNETVFFLTRCGTGYETRWADFIKYCEWFLGWYDEGLLFHPTAREVTVFWEECAMFVGRRSERKLKLLEA